jgi:hypothetical protein
MLNALDALLSEALPAVAASLDGCVFLAVAMVVESKWPCYPLIVGSVSAGVPAALECRGDQSGRFYNWCLYAMRVHYNREQAARHTAVPIPPVRARAAFWWQTCCCCECATVVWD